MRITGYEIVSVDYAQDLPQHAALDHYDVFVWREGWANPMFIGRKDGRVEADCAGFNASLGFIA